jgi:hypothetical protein
MRHYGLSLGTVSWFYVTCFELFTVLNDMLPSNVSSVSPVISMYWRCTKRNTWEWEFRKRARRRWKVEAIWWGLRRLSELWGEGLRRRPRAELVHERIRVRCWWGWRRGRIHGGLKREGILRSLRKLRDLGVGLSGRCLNNRTLLW